MDLDINLIPNNNNNSIAKFSIVNNEKKIIKYNICNVYAPFGRQYNHYSKYKINQDRLNICFSKDEINDNNDIYIYLTNIIKTIENFFSNITELENYNLISNIIDRESYGIVIRFNLKKYKNNTLSNLKQIINSVVLKVDWIQFDKYKKCNIEFYLDSLWIDHINKNYGVNLIISDVLQFIN